MHHPLGTLLLQEHMLKEEDLERVENTCRQQNCSFEEAVSRLGLLTEETIRVFKEHLPSLVLTQLVETDPNLLELVPETLARRYMCIPVANLGGTLTVALADPSDKEVLEAMVRETGRPVDAVPALEADLERAVSYHYGAGGAEPGEAPAEEAAPEAVPVPEPAAAPEGPPPEAEAPAPAEEIPAPEEEEVEEEAPPHTRAEVVVDDMEEPPPQVVFANRLLGQMILRQAERVEVRWKGATLAEAAIFEKGRREALAAITPARAGQVIQRYRVLADMLLQSRKKPQSGNFTVKMRFEDNLVEDIRFRVHIVPIGELEGEVATVTLAPESAPQAARPVADEEEHPTRCPACGALEVFSRFRYCPLCGVGIR